MAPSRKQRRDSFGKILRRLREGDADAIVTGLAELRSDPDLAGPIADYLSTKFGEDPKLTRVLIRAAGSIDSPPLHILLASRLMDQSASDYLFDIIDALGRTGQPEYAGLIIPFLDDRYGFEVQSTAAHALGLLGSPLGIPSLLRVMAHKRGPLHTLAVEALRRLVKQPDPLLDVALKRHSPQFQINFRKKVFQPATQGARRGKI